MYHKPITPKPANKNSTRQSDAKPDQDVKLHLVDFEQWLERELVKLEARYASFTTTVSNRQFFAR